MVPLASDPGGRQSFLILFDDGSRLPVGRSMPSPVPGADRIREGQTARAPGARARKHAGVHARSANEAHESVQEELRSAHEEMLSANEEFQSTNEELETSKEELQSTNEELTTTIDELQTRNEELARLNADLDVAQRLVRDSARLCRHDHRVRSPAAGSAR